MRGYCCGFIELVLRVPGYANHLFSALKLLFLFVIFSYHTYMWKGKDSDMVFTKFSAIELFLTKLII